jgi:hypothetical protein
VRIDYEIDSLDPITPDVNIKLKVILDGNLFDEILLIPSGELPSNKIKDMINYQPAQGWQNGNYSFIAELYAGEQICGTAIKEGIPSSLGVTVSWGLLFGFLGGAMMVSAAVIILILIRYRRLNRTFKFYMRGFIPEKNKR